MGPRRVVARSRGARRRCGFALAAAVLLATAACAYSDNEPGLFGHSEPSPSASGPSFSPTGIQPENPNLPVLGEQTWTSGDGFGLQVRIAVHAVRRMQGATVLDYSVTPIAGTGLHVGDPVPSTADLGLNREGEGGTDIFLLDGPGKAVYRPLTQRAPSNLEQCLCTPLWVAQRAMRIGETRLLQIAYPPLPATVATVDVDVATVPLVFHVPVSDLNTAPTTAAALVSLARPAERPTPLAQSPVFTYVTGQRMRVGLVRVVAGTSFTVLQWTIRSMSAGGGVDVADSPPLVDDGSKQPAYNSTSATGPRLQLHDGAWLSPRLMTTRLQGLGHPECLCSDLRLWARGMALPNTTITVVTTFPALPSGTRRIDVVFGGLPVMRQVPVSAASDASIRTGDPVHHASDGWIYNLSDPPSGWLDDAWPTPLPDPRQLSGFRPTVDSLIGG